MPSSKADIMPPLSSISTSIGRRRRRIFKSKFRNYSLSFYSCQPLALLLVCCRLLALSLSSSLIVSIHGMRVSYVSRHHLSLLVTHHHHHHHHHQIKNDKIKILALPVLQRQINIPSSFCCLSSSFCSQVNDGSFSSSCIAEEDEWRCLPYCGKIKTKQSTTASTISNLLVVGDGDLSYSASIASTLHKLGIHMISTVLETKDAHNRIYSQSNINRNIIEYFGHSVYFGIDGTNIQIYPEIASKLYDRIQFNFPHCSGKSNIRQNRLLLQGFLQSSSQLLSSVGGEIHVALFSNQGGASAKNLQEWKRSWLSTYYGAECGLLLASVTPFTYQYKRSSYRGQDKPFDHFSNNNKNNAQLYKFVLGPSTASSTAASKISGTCYGEVGAEEEEALSSYLIPDHLQLCFRHELHVHVPSTSCNDCLERQKHPKHNTNNHDPFQQSQPLIDDLVEGDFIRSKLQELVPYGVLVEVPYRHQQLIRTKSYQNKDTVEETEKEEQLTIICFLIVYRAVTRPVTRNEANTYRDRAEQTIGKTFPLRRNRMGKTVSRPFPYCVLQSVVEDIKLRMIEKEQK